MEGAAVAGINGGMDQEGGGNAAISMLAQAVKDRRVNASTIATSFRRLFRIRIRLGMFDPPTSVSYNRLNATEAASPAHLAITKQAALRSMTLLKVSA